MEVVGCRRYLLGVLLSGRWSQPRGGPGVCPAGRLGRAVAFSSGLRLVGYSIDKCEFCKVAGRGKFFGGGMKVLLS